MNILVTGGAGFIASHLAEALLKQGHHVVILDDLSGGFERNVPAGAKFVPGSVNNFALVNFLCRNEKIEAIYHLAAYAAEGLSHFIRRFNYINNVVGSVNVINAAVEFGVKKLVFTSSMAVYGREKTPFTEETPREPVDPYGIAKLAVEQDLFAAAEMWGLNYTVFRPHNVYGPKQHIGDRYRNVVGIFMNQVLRGQPLTIFGDGEQTRAFSYVTDILGPMISCLSDVEHDEGAGPSAWESFNIGGATVYTVNQLAEAVLKVTESKVGVVHLPERHEVKYAYCDHSKLERVFGPQPQTVLETGLEAMWRWARDLGPQDPLETPAVEVDKNLPPSWR